MEIRDMLWKENISQGVGEKSGNVITLKKAHLDRKTMSHFPIIW